MNAPVGEVVNHLFNVALHFCKSVFFVKFFNEQITIFIEGFHLLFRERLQTGARVNQMREEKKKKKKNNNKRDQKQKGLTPGLSRSGFRCHVAGGN